MARQPSLATPLAIILPILGGALTASPPAGYGRIEIVRDRWGVPNVFSETDAGAMYGLGHACAEDRLFQMCLHRRVMQGRLAETLGNLEGRRGKTALDEDRRMRVLGFYRVAREVVTHLDAETRRFLEAYSEGVNDYMTAHAADLHHLFERYEFEPEPWEPADCIVSWWHLARFFASDGLRDRLPGPQSPGARGRGTPRVRPVVDDDAAVVRREDVSEEWIRQTEEFMREHGLLPEKPGADRAEGPKFSHAWVVGGARTTSGSAVLVSDPRTPVWNPSMLHEFHISGKTFNARGVGVPGSPVVLIGFNETAAWGMTALGADQADLFVLETGESQPDRYRVDGEWRAMEVREETIRVRGGDAVKVKIRKTVFGPVVSEFVRQRRDGQEVALKRVPLADPRSETVQAAVAMLRSGTVQELGQALGAWRFPSANCVFGDRSGSIGYWTVGSIPLRAAGSSSGAMAHDGSTLAADWQGMVPHELVPHVIDPRRGYLVSANHRTIQSFYRLTLGASTGANGDTLRGLRIKERILEHLSGHEKFRPGDVLAIHADAVNPCKREIIRCGYHIRDRLDGRLKSEALRALEHLEAWYEAGARSDLRVPGTELANEMRFIFRAGVFPLARTYGGGDSGAALFTKTVKSRLDADPSADLTADERAFVETVLATAWTGAVRRYGSDPSRWHTRAIADGQKQSLGYQADLDGYPSLDTGQDVPLPLLPVVDGSTIASQRSQAYTQYVPLHDPDAALSILPFGASERPGSPFRFSTWSDWSVGELHPAPLSREAVQAIAVLHVRLSALPAPPEVARSGDRDTEVLPGERPSDPELERLVRALIGRDRAPEEIDATLVEIRSHVRGDEDLTAQAISVFRLVVYLEYGTEHARSVLREAIMAMGGQLPPRRPERYRREQEERRRRAAGERRRP